MRRGSIALMAEPIRSLEAEILSSEAVFMYAHSQRLTMCIQNEKIKQFFVLLFFSPLELLSDEEKACFRHKGIC